jgi:phosphoadenosine phosphosulfate reductase
MGYSDKIEIEQRGHMKKNKNQIFDSFLKDLETKAVSLLVENCPENGYYGCFSGGKDSVVIKHLCQIAGVNVSWHYNVTTIDPPELIYFMKKFHDDVIWERPPHGPFFKRAIKVGFPTRKNRWCCREYKEGTLPKGHTSIMGIRGEESVTRAKRWNEKCTHYRTQDLVICPIYTWSSDELWSYIYAKKIDYCNLYDEGFHRLGCVGCPMSRHERFHHFQRWPKYEEKWRKLFDKIWEKRSGSIWRGKKWFGDRYFENSTEMFDWWLNDRKLPT